MEIGFSGGWSDFGARRSQTRQDVKVRHEESVLSLVDAFALRACRRAHPIRFGLVERDADREAVSRVCGAIAPTRARQEESPAIVFDRINDADAVWLAGWDADRVVAASRLVLPAAGRKLPTESAFDLRIEPSGRVVDAAWFGVVREYSSLEHRVLTGLLGRSWLEIRARGFSHVCASLSGGAMRVFERIGLKMILLAPSRRRLRKDRYPVTFDMVAAAPHLFDR